MLVGKVLVGKVGSMHAAVRCLVVAIVLGLGCGDEGPSPSGPPPGGDGGSVATGPGGSSLTGAGGTGGTGTSGTATGGGAGTGGTCAAGMPPTLDDGNPCTVDACDPILGVTHAPAPAGAPCPDANPCNGEEICDGLGACAQLVPPAIDDGDPCTFDACDPVTGITHTGCAPLDLTLTTTPGEALAFLWSGPDCYGSVCLMLSGSACVMPIIETARHRAA